MNSNPTWSDHANRLVDGVRSLMRNWPWNLLRRVVHLHRRAAFTPGTWDELQRDLKDGPEKSVGRLLNGTANLHPANEFDAVAALLFDAAASQSDIGRLKAAWFYRFLFSPHPLLEKLTLLWHDHFATANSKVMDVALMRQQNDTLRKHARGKFADLLNAAVRDPALLLYLDAPANRKGRANENLSRELLELFTLGVGNFAERNGRERGRGARSLAGRSTMAVSLRYPERQLPIRVKRQSSGEKRAFDGTQR